MTDSKTYQVAGADVIITASVFQQSIAVNITVDLSALDVEEPDHSPHQLIGYIKPLLPHYTTKQSYWWSKLHRSVFCKSGSQARRVIKAAVVTIDDAVSQALIDRVARKSQMNIIFS